MSRDTFLDLRESYRQRFAVASESMEANPLRFGPLGGHWSRFFGSITHYVDGIGVCEIDADGDVWSPSGDKLCNVGNVRPTVL